MIYKREVAIDYAKRFIGIRYYKGSGAPDSPITEGDDPVYGFTCSGLICEILRGVGLLGHRDRLTAIKIYRRFEANAVTGPPRRGDLVFYGKMEPGIEPELVHIAMMLDDWHIIEAGGGNNDTDTDIEAAKRNAFVRIRPVEFRENERVAICRIWEA
jgi:cell wall-associated NlpC family hydrolase